MTRWLFLAFLALYNASGSSEEYFQRSLFRWADSPIAGQVRELLAVIGNLLGLVMVALVCLLVVSVGRLRVVMKQAEA